MLNRYAIIPLYVLPFLPAALHAQGDACGNAVTVVPGTYTADGPSSGNGASHSDAVHADWYAFTPATDGFLTVMSCGSQVDTRVHVHEGTCGGLTLISDDDDGCPDGSGGSLLANVPVLPGVTYYIEWDDHHSTSGFDWQFFLHGCPIAVPIFTASMQSILIDWPVLAAGAQFTLEYGPAGFTPGTGTVISGTQGNGQPPLTITGLIANTAYDVYISTDCGGGSVSPFNGPWHTATTNTSGIPNDPCEGAITITCGSTTQGVTTDAATDDAPDCGTSITAPGVWYTFTGISGTIVLSTCADHDFDTKINVYTGACDDLQCVDGNDDGGFCAYGSELIMTVDPAQTYYVLVQGYNGETGSFSLLLDCPTCPPPVGIFVTSADVQAFVYWTTQNAGGTYTVEFDTAGFTFGTGSVVTGIIGTDGPPAHLTNLEPGTDYDVYVTEDCGSGNVSYTRGPIGYTTLTAPVATNALCAGAAPIACGQSLDGNTAESIYSPGPWCGSADITAPGLWYSFVGDGQDVTLSTCNAANYDTKISVFSGTCIDLVCVAGDDDGTGCATTSSITFATVSGTGYLAMVHGYQQDTGTFTLSMICTTPCSPAVTNDDCANAQTLAPQLTGSCVPVQSTNVCAYASALPNPPCDPYAPIHDVWFAVNTGPSTDHVLTVAPLTSAPMGVAVYASCDSLDYIGCYSTDNGPIALTGLLLNTMYYVRVWNGGGADEGTFTICDEADNLVGLEDRSAEGGLHVWPIPADGMLNIEGIMPGAKTLRLMDAEGRTVLSRTITSTGLQQLGTAALAPGAYVLRAEGDASQVVRVVLR